MIFGTDASSLVPRSGRGWKLRVKRALWPALFSLADQIIVPSSAGRDLMLSLGIRQERLTLTPYSVENDWWARQSQKVDRDQVRATWGAGPETCVILFCAKLQPWKRPLDLLRSFAQAKLPNALLVFAAEGAQRSEHEAQATALRISNQLRFLGFLNQSQLPAVYTSADLMVLPSEYEPFAVVVNEASCCGCPSVTSDRVGAARDLVAPVEPRLIFPCGDIPALSTLLHDLCADHSRLRQLGRAAKDRMATWAPENTVEAAVRRRKR